MRIKVCILIVLALALFVMPIAAQAHDGSEPSQEYQIKAAFLYNFIKFVDWPKEKIGDSNQPIIIGICYHENHIRTFELLQGRKVKGRRVVVKPFGDFEELKESGEKDKAEIKRQIEALRKCHLFFICSPRKNNVGEIIEALKGSSILTIGETAGFLESGGIINFLMEEKKVRFEVNIAAAERAKLEIRSKLLRLAKRVVKEDTAREKQK